MGKKAMGGEEKGKSGFYETFDSGDGVIVPPGEEGNFAHKDSGDLYGIDVEDAAVPEVPAKKR